MNRFEIKMVTFDLWETLLLERDGADARRTLVRCRNLAKVLYRLGFNFSNEQLLSALEAMTPWFTAIWERNRDVTDIEQIQFIVNKVSNGSLVLKNEWINELKTAYVSPLFEVSPYLNPDTQKVLNWLKERKKRIGLICNTGSIAGHGLRQFLKQESIADFFDLMLFSDEVGIRKPDPKIFQIAVEQINCKPYEAVHIGDNLKSDIFGAKKAGFKTIYLSALIGRDRVAESEQTSLVSISRNLGTLKESEIIPDRVIQSLDKVIEEIKNLEDS